VTRADALKAGERLIVDVDGRSVGVFNVDGNFFALLNRCPHQGGPLCLGEIFDLVESDGPGDFQLDPDVQLVACPWHGWEFDLRTGQSYFDPERTRVRAYRVDVKTGEAVNADGEVAPAAFSVGRRPGPYRAEVVPVSVEGDYLVLTLSRSAASPPGREATG
jgi:3-phenylpropionate/trans-cinnamate dioxygenase ferredoxin subunit